MASIRVDVDAPFVPWILINQPGDFSIEFRNTDPVHRKTVNFMNGAPPDISLQNPFHLSAGGGTATFVVKGTAVNGKYPFTASNGSTGNGGIEIDR